MSLDLLQYGLGGVSGLMVGLALGLFGGGGSILAVPLMVYLVGVPSPHIAIGTSAVAVAANAGASIVAHAGQGHVNWRCAGVYSSAGVLGALLGSMAGKAIDGQKLLFLFALLMMLVAAMIFRNRGRDEDPTAECTLETSPKVLAYGASTGAFSGFFGIGGRFLIVPALIASTGMPMLNAVGSSLVAVAAFGLATAWTYSISGLVDWSLALVFVTGGIAGSAFGAKLACRVNEHKGALNVAFATLVLSVAIYMAPRACSPFRPDGPKNKSSAHFQI